MYVGGEYEEEEGGGSLLSDSNSSDRFACHPRGGVYWLFTGPSTQLARYCWIIVWAVANNFNEIT